VAHILGLLRVCCAPQPSDVDKFNYLRSLLKHTAYDVIASLTLSSANYVEAIDILKKQFGDQQLIISKHTEVLLGIEAVVSDKNCVAFADCMTRWNHPYEA